MYQPIQDEHEAGSAVARIRWLAKEERAARASAKYWRSVAARRAAESACITLEVVYLDEILHQDMCYQGALARIEYAHGERNRIKHFLKAYRLRNR